MPNPSASKSSKRQSALGVTTRVLRIRIKDKHASLLNRQAIEVNQVWNFCQESSLKILDREQRFCTAYDLDKLTAGATKGGLSLHSQTVQAISAEYCTRRRQFKRAKLRWRVSRGTRRSLGWIPFKAVAISYRNGQLHYQGQALSLWDSFGLAGYKLRGGNFSEDARGRWYVNITVDKAKPSAAVPQMANSVGIDLGLKELAALSTGAKVEAQQFYRDLEPALAIAQRAGKKNRVKALHAKIANRRKDHLHKLSTALVRRYGAIFVGDVSSSKLAKTKMAKSVLDAGWSSLKTQLLYKGDDAGRWVRIISESYSTQDCSACGTRAGPKGQSGLSTRAWICPACQTVHDRDVNAARNIELRGLALLESEFSVAGEAKACEAATNKAWLSQAGAGLGPLAEGIPC